MLSSLFSHTWCCCHLLYRHDYWWTIVGWAACWLRLFPRWIRFGCRWCLSKRDGWSGYARYPSEVESGCFDLCCPANTCIQDGHTPLSRSSDLVKISLRIPGPISCPSIDHTQVNIWFLFIHHFISIFWYLLLLGAKWTTLFIISNIYSFSNSGISFDKDKI